MADAGGDEEYEHFDAKYAITNLFRTVDKKSILIGWTRLCQMLGYMHATAAEGSSQKSERFLPL